MGQNYQDNASISPSLQLENVPTLDWPLQSPDLNPIENLWAIVKAKLKKNFSTPKTKSELIDQVFAVWEDINFEILNTYEVPIKSKVLFNGRTISNIKLIPSETVCPFCTESEVISLN